MSECLNTGHGTSNVERPWNAERRTLNVTSNGEHLNRMHVGTRLSALGPRSREAFDGQWGHRRGAVRCEGDGGGPRLRASPPPPASCQCPCQGVRDSVGGQGGRAWWGRRA